MTEEMKRKLGKNCQNCQKFLYHITIISLRFALKAIDHELIKTHNEYTGALPQTLE